MNPCLHRTRKSLNDEGGLQNFPLSPVTAKGRSENQNLRPHIFAIGEKCCKKLLSVGNEQVVIVSGDSGAGKTTATQQLLRHFIRKNEALRHPQTPTGLDRKISFATAVLESMGNAATLANVNSSRFGRLVQLNYEPTYGSIVGASIRTCLLEKHRVAKCSPNERNFHIFYLTLGGLQQGTLRLVDFLDTDELEFNVEGLDWRQLIPSHFLEDLKQEDTQDFEALHRSLKSLHLVEEFQFVFRIVFGLMALLQVEFVHEEDEEFTAAPSARISLQIAAAIFGLETEELLEALIARRIIAGGGRAGGTRKSIFRKPCGSRQECEERRAAFVSSLYDGVFAHVLARVNLMLRVTTALQDDDLDFNIDIELRNLQISLLDLYGFENTEVNHLEQLCINYANERLHLVYLQSLRIHKPDTSASSFGELDKIERDSTARLDLLQSLLFSALNEECLLSRTKDSNSDVKLYEKLTMATSSNGKFFEFRQIRNAAAAPFVVRHYAADVEYSLRGMVQKNADYVPPEFGQLLGASQNVRVRGLLSPSTTTTPSASRSKREKTVLQKFRVQVDELINALRSHEEEGEERDVHFIKCIRPAPAETSRPCRATVRRQLHSAGLVDAIKIAGNGLPIRVPKSRFVRTFGGMVRRFALDGDLERLEKLLPDGSMHPQISITPTLVCLTEDAWSHLKALRSLVHGVSAHRIARAWRLARRRKAEWVAAAAIAKAKSESKIERASPSQAKKSFPDAVRDLRPLFHELNLGVDDWLVTRGQIHRGPKHFFTLPSLLPFAHVVPRCHRSQGLAELLA